MIMCGFTVNLGSGNVPSCAEEQRWIHHPEGICLLGNASRGPGGFHRNETANGVAKAGARRTGCAYFRCWGSLGRWCPVVHREEQLIHSGQHVQTPAAKQSVTHSLVIDTILYGF